MTDDDPLHAANANTHIGQRRAVGHVTQAFGYTPKGTHSRGTGDGGPKARARAEEGVHEGWTESTREILALRNMRNVWMFPTQPYAGAHFATFPEEIPRRCILAATSARGACRQCGAPWERVIAEYGVTEHDGHTGSNYPVGSNANRLAMLRQAAREHGAEYAANSKTIGWMPTCLCRGQRGRTRPCVVLDPFGGSGTVARVAIELNRNAVSLDLAYHEHAKERTTNVQRSLLLDGAAHVAGEASVGDQDGAL